MRPVFLSSCGIAILEDFYAGECFLTVHFVVCGEEKEQDLCRSAESRSLMRNLTTQSFYALSTDGQSCPVMSWDASLYPDGIAAGPATVRVTWGEYQSSLKQRCWHKNISPKSDSGCSTIHHYEWSKVVLFDFLLQVTKAV